MRFFAVGDSITFGMGDRERLGWLGRLPAPEDVYYFNLGVPGQIVGEFLARAHAEVSARMVPYHDTRIFIGGGLNDLSLDEAGNLRTDLSTLRAQIEALIEAMRALAPTLVLGPPPVDESLNPHFIGALGEHRAFKNAAIAEIDEIYAHIANAHGVPYLSLYNLLKDDQSYLGSLLDNDGIHPEEMGYIAIADYVSNWTAFREKLPNE